MNNKPKTYEDGFFAAIEAVREMLNRFDKETTLVYPVLNEVGIRVGRLEREFMNRLLAERSGQ